MMAYPHKAYMNSFLIEFFNHGSGVKINLCLANAINVFPMLYTLGNWHTC